MENEEKYNKRPRSYTDFRSSYSDNRRLFSSAGKAERKQFFLKLFFGFLIFAAVALAGFLITDALLTISEEPYDASEVTTQPQTTEIDDKYFENQVTVSADKVDENVNNSDMRE